jgi:hypothetical protein
VKGDDFWLTIITPLPVFFVSVDSKGLSVPISYLESILTPGFTSVDSKGFIAGTTRRPI